MARTVSHIPFNCKADIFETTLLRQLVESSALIILVAEWSADQNHGGGCMSVHGIAMPPIRTDAVDTLV